VRPRRIDSPDARTQSRRVAEISHDLRTPLASLRLLVEGLSDGVLGDEDRHAYLAQMQTQVSLLTELVDDLHALSSTHALSSMHAGESSSREAVDPNDLIDRTLAAMRIQAEARGVVLQREASAILPVICANALALQRVLVNLIENAIRHTDAGGHVTIRAHPSLGRIELEVQDDGDGIPAHERGRVFRAFYGHDGEHSVARSGLGMAIAQAAVEEHGGRIWLDDSPQGTRVRITLPTSAPRARPASRSHALSASSNDSISMAPRRLESAPGS
jgi:signal transduction histidine kinase